MARTSRGSDDHVKWRSRLLILNGMITEKIQHPNDFPPENHIHRLALTLCRKNVERFTFLLVPSDRKTIQKVRSLLVRNLTHALCDTGIHWCSALPIELMTGQLRAGIANQHFKITGTDHSTTHYFFFFKNTRTILFGPLPAGNPWQLSFEYTFFKENVQFWNWGCTFLFFAIWGLKTLLKCS